MDITWLGKKEEIEFTKIKFSGKLGRKAWKYAQHIDKIIMVRAVIFILSILMFYRVLTNYLFHDFFSLDFFIERVIFGLVFIVAGLIYNKYRIAAIVIASLPIILILTSSIMYDGFRGGAFNAAVLLIILSGIYYHFQAKKIRKELEQALVENPLIYQSNVNESRNNNSQKLAVTIRDKIIEVQGYDVHGNSPKGKINEGLLMVLNGLKEPYEVELERNPNLKILGNLTYTFRLESDGLVRMLMEMGADFSDESHNDLGNKFTSDLMQKRIKFPELGEQAMVEATFIFK